MSDSIQSKVREFHEVFGLTVSETPHIPGSKVLVDMRRNILLEEVEELCEASEKDDLVEIADALADIVYIAYGTALTYGIDLDCVLAEVHKSNMSKLGPDGLPIYREDGKILKGPNYFKPNIRGALGGSDG